MKKTISKMPRLLTVNYKHGITYARHQWPNSTNSFRIAFSSSIFARFSPLRLFPVSRPEEMVRRKEIYHQRAAHRRNRGLFWRLDKSYYSDGLKKLENRWINESNWKKIMLRNKNESIKNKCVLLCFSKNLLTCPRIFAMAIASESLQLRYILSHTRCK